MKVVKWLETPQGSILATSSWDKTVKVLRIQSPHWAWYLSFEYDLVLGHAFSESDLNGATAREVLHTRRLVPSLGCRHRGASRPDIQPHESHDSLQGAKGIIPSITGLTLRLRP